MLCIHNVPCLLVHLIDCCPWSRSKAGISHTTSISNVSLDILLCQNVFLKSDSLFSFLHSVSHHRRYRKVHKWQVGDNSCGGSFKGDKTRWPSLDLPLQSAAEGRLPKEIWLQQFQQESASKGGVHIQLNVDWVSAAVRFPSSFGIVLFCFIHFSCNWLIVN